MMSQSSLRVVVVVVFEECKGEEWGIEIFEEEGEEEVSGEEEALSGEEGWRRVRMGAASAAAAEDDDGDCESVGADDVKVVRRRRRMKKLKLKLKLRDGAIITPSRRR